jgi:hypothetical protein
LDHGSSAMITCSYSIEDKNYKKKQRKINGVLMNIDSNAKVILKIGNSLVLLPEGLSLFPQLIGPALDFICFDA